MDFLKYHTKNPPNYEYKKVDLIAMRMFFCFKEGNECLKNYFPFEYRIDCNPEM